MNSTFVIEPKYDNGVGFLVLDNTRKLVRHFECIISEKIHMTIYMTNDVYQIHITIDVYQDGLINIYRRNKNDYFEQIQLLLSLELTNGEDINEHYLDLLESIYSPFCERNPKGTSCEYPIIKKLDHIRSEFAEPDKVELVIDLITKTFKTLHIMKKMY
jgi:hypothetical protein